MYNGMEFITGRNWNYKPHQGNYQQRNDKIVSWNKLDKDYAKCFKSIFFLWNILKKIMCCGKQTNVQFIDVTCGVLKSYIK